MTDASRLYEALVAAVEPPLAGQRDVIEFLAVALFARGHATLGGGPIAESAAIASAFARGLGLPRERVRLTPDLERADLLEGADPDGNDPGRLFSRNVLLADEVNRAPPGVRTTLVEAMEDGRIAVGGDVVDVPRPFMVIATLTPVESDEVYGLPASHRDPFLFDVRVDDLDRDAGLALLDHYDVEGPGGLDEVEPVAGPDAVLSIQDAVARTYVDDSIKEYLIDVVIGTREHPDVEHGAASRAALSLLRAVKSYAAVRDRDFVIPDDVKAIAGPALAPRIALNTEAELDGVASRDVVGEVIDSVVPPGTEFDVEQG